MDSSDKNAVGEYEDRSPSRATWMRGLFMFLLLLAFGAAQGVLWLLAIVQFVWMLFSGEANVNLARFGKSLSLWLAELARFVSFASEVKPFPWAPWPSAD
jgi:Domain of unknown function (DUF4389)